jgi:serine/threonine-protein kinase
MYPGATDWLAPPSRLLAGSGLEMPSVEGLSVEEATTLLVGLGLKVKLGPFESSDYVDEGDVTGTDPAEGELVAGGMVVKLYRSSGPEPEPEIEIPDVVGLSEEDAIAELESADISVSVDCSVADDPEDLDIGYVINQSGSGPVTITVLKESCP